LNELFFHKYTLQKDMTYWWERWFKYHYFK